ncbi:unnamed protein product [Lupinus luteus]|uniref:Uncharacterized protein n=1 Tax=Lupinus luteus TaxID=3873 RepID=A0AAV1XU32_LUPLU
MSFSELNILRFPLTVYGQLANSETPLEERLNSCAQLEYVSTVQTRPSPSARLGNLGARASVMAPSQARLAQRLACLAPNLGHMRLLCPRGLGHVCDLDSCLCQTWHLGLVLGQCHATRLVHP